MLMQRAEYQRVFVGHDATRKEGIQELRKSREERGHLEKHIMELMEQVTSLNFQVKGNVTNMTKQGRFYMTNNY